MADGRRGSQLSVRDLRIEATTAGSGRPGRRLVDGVELDLAPGEAVALVGPSGCGKSLTALALLGLLPPQVNWVGDITWEGESLREPRGRRWARVRGRGIGLILQDPRTGLNPVTRVGDQVAETIAFHHGLSRRAARLRALDLLAEVHLPDPQTAARQYPHQLSGGMRQRVLLAAALACEPRLLIADEPTTALDLSIQKEILALLGRVRRERGMGLIFITHDLNLVPLLADRVAFMADGRIERWAEASALEFPAPPSGARPDTSADMVLTAEGVRVEYRGRQEAAVRGVDLQLRAGRAVGVLGESGSGKTSLGRALSRHVECASGLVRLTGDGEISPAQHRRADERNRRRRVQMLFQDPGSSLNPYRTIGEMLGEAVPAPPASALPLLAEVGLEGDLAGRYPHQLSGGQRQRVALARCLAASPAVLIADEPTSALDPAARDLVLALLARIMANRGLALMLISHDLEVLQGFCHEVHVMKRGLVVEVMPGHGLSSPRHPYTQELVRALPRTLREPAAIGSAPSSVPSVPSDPGGCGCPWFGPCSLQKPICGKELPPLRPLADGSRLRCPWAEDGGSPHFIDT